MLKYIQITGTPKIRDNGIIKMAGQAHLLRNPSNGELKLSASQKKTYKRELRELESFPENGL